MYGEIVMQILAMHLARILHLTPSQ
jgi:hypothetical protein